MADYNRLDSNGAIFLVNYMFQKLAGSPLAGGTDYTIEKSADGKNLILKDGEGTAVVTLENVLYPPTDASKVASITEGAAANIIESIKVNGTALTVTEKAVDITVPTDNSSLANGAGYQTEAEVTAAINAALASFSGGITFTKVANKDALPDTGEEGHIYLVPNTTLSGDSYYDEYFWDEDGSKYELFGSTQISLDGYVQASEMSTVTNAEITTMVDEAYEAVFGTPAP